ncbi:hypothetical protein GCM10010917_29200 [Paenibacillus physcomitrellae]|uniref:Uncharacterized protein n=1 Tax=Paenibacillus physcomitrellae TaxID=1619311 RepID=A0ABQ1GE72_9BACL|nr:hypothetical protein GCM10010917_29200 [Paenibacillus physcomitrellae]
MAVPLIYDMSKVPNVTYITSVEDSVPAADSRTCSIKGQSVGLAKPEDYGVSHLSGTKGILVRFAVLLTLANKLLECAGNLFAGTHYTV